VSFYAPDSEQAGMLARAQEIENLERQQRAQSLIADEARRARCAWRRPTPMRRAAPASARRDAAEAQTRAHQLQVELLRLTQQADAAHSRREQLGGELAELDASSRGSRSAGPPARRRFEELDMQLADTQERHAELDDAVIAAERRLADAREQQRALERQAQEAQFQARAAGWRRGELQRGIETAHPADRRCNEAGWRSNWSWPATSTTRRRRPGCRTALALQSEREQALAAARSDYDDLNARLRQPTSSACSSSAASSRCASRSPSCSSRSRPRSWAARSTWSSCGRRGRRLEALARSIDEGGVKLWGLQGEIDRIQREINGAGRGQPGGAGRADQRRASARPSSTRRTPT
jgi:chromosome segregation protein